MTDAAQGLTEALQSAPEPTSEVAGEQVPDSQEQRDYLETLVGDGKKYKDVQELARAYFNADIHIRELTSELDDERTNSEDLRKSMDEVLSEIRREDRSNMAPPNAERNSAAAQSGTSKEDVAKLVEETLTAKEKAKIAETNTRKALDLLTEHYGDKQQALKAVNAVTKGDAVMSKMLNEMGAFNPEAAFRFVTGEVPKHTPGSNTPDFGVGQNGGSLKGRPHQLTWTDCSKLRKENPKRYNSPEFRKEMEQAAAAYESAGQDFFAT